MHAGRMFYSVLVFAPTPSGRAEKFFHDTNVAMNGWTFGLRALHEHHEEHSIDFEPLIEFSFVLFPLDDNMFKFRYSTVMNFAM